MDREKIAAWARGHAAAERRAASERARSLPSAEDALQDGLDLIDLVAEVLGWPLPQTPAEIEADAACLADRQLLWSKLRGS